MIFFCAPPFRLFCQHDVGHIHSSLVNCRHFYIYQNTIIPLWLDWTYINQIKRKFGPFVSGQYALLDHVLLLQVKFFFYSLDLFRVVPVIFHLCIFQKHNFGAFLTYPGRDCTYINPLKRNFGPFTRHQDTILDL